MSFTRQVMAKIAPFMKENGYIQMNRVFYRIQNDIAYCIGFEMPNGSLYVWQYILPLYIPAEFPYLTYGSRLNRMPDVRLSFLDKDADQDEILRWCIKLRQQLTEVIFPYFEEISSPAKLMRFLESWFTMKGKYLCIPPIHFCRLQLYTHLYLGNIPKVEKVARKYRRVLKKSTTYTQAAISRDLKEIDAVLSLLAGSPEELEHFFDETIENTIQCFFAKRHKR